MTRVRISVYLGEAGHKLGPGKVQLLEAIDQHGSLSAAARSMGMAYRHAWEMVDELNRCFARPVVEMATGGRAGGGARLTPWGREVVRRFHRIEAGAQRAAGPHLRALDAQLDPDEPPRRHRKGGARPS